jgi:hypothetical protein
VVASSSEGAWHTASSTSPSTGYDISPEAFVCGHGDGLCRWRSWGGVAGAWPGHGGRRWLAVASAIRSCWSWSGRRRQDGGRSGWSCPPCFPFDMVAVGVDLRLRACVSSLFRSC